jgi:proline iminopeptidase
LFVRWVGSGPPIVVLHGGPGLSHDYLAPQLIELLASEYQLIFYDQRASGRSSGVQDTTRLHIAQFVEDLEQLRRGLGLERLNLLGHSFGGLLAMYYAAEHPGAVSRLLLIDTSPASWELNFPAFRQAIAERQTEEDRREIAAITEVAGWNEDPATMDRYYKLYFRPFFKDPRQSERLTLGVDQQWLSNLAVTNGLVWGSMGQYDIHDRLAGITASTLIVHGTASVIAMEGARAVAAHIPGSQLVILPDVGHFPHIEAPQALAGAVKAFMIRP